jgi:hypothetical protein
MGSKKKGDVQELRRSGRLLQALSGSRHWINGMVERQCRVRDLGTEVMLQMLVGGWLCHEVLEDRSVCEAIAATACSELERKKDGLADELIECDGALVAFSAGIFKALGLECSTLMNLLSEVAQALAQSNQTKLVANQTMMLPIFFLLSKLKVGDIGPKRAEAQVKLSGNYRELLFACREDLDEFITALNAWSLYGRRRASIIGEHRTTIKSLLRVWCHEQLRQYDMVRASALLRTMRYLGMDKDAWYCTGLEFLLAQQQPDGRFGFFGPEQRILRGDDAECDKIPRMYVSVTVACMWTLAEAADRRFCLYHSI